jgi:hypothetical protein
VSFDPAAGWRSLAAKIAPCSALSWRRTSGAVPSCAAIRRSRRSSWGPATIRAKLPIQRTALIQVRWALQRSTRLALDHPDSLASVRLISTAPIGRAAMPSAPLV